MRGRKRFEKPSANEEESSSSEFFFFFFFYKVGLGEEEERWIEETTENGF